MPSPLKVWWKALTADPAVIESIQNRTANFIQPLGGSNVSQSMRAAIQRAQAANYAWMYANQPVVRTTVDMISSNLSQLGLKLFERVSDTERKTAGDHPAALTMRYPNEATPADLFIHEFVSDYLVYNNAYAVKFRRGPSSPLTLIRLLPHLVSVLGQGYAVTGYRVYRTDGSWQDFPPDDLIHWRNYNPQDPRLGISPLETLRATLVQESATMAVLTELAQNGLAGGYLKRPLEAPEMSLEAEQRFMEAWANARKSSPRKTPLLQEGMEWIQTTMAPKDAELLASREFTREEVATQYGIPVGLLTGEGDQEQQLKRFYADVLAPLAKRLACQLDLSLLQMEFMRTDLYFDFNLEAKTQGDIESRLPNLVAAAGAPIMLRDEARAILNLPKVDGGDELVTPLNVIVGDNPKPAPNVMGPQDPNKPPQDGSYREIPPPSNGGKALEVTNRTKRIADEARQRRYIDEVQGALEKFFRRQLRALEGSKAAFDTARWDREARQDLEPVIRSVIEREGGIYVSRLGGDDFDMRQVTNYISAMVGSWVQKMNAATQRDWETTDRTAREAIDRAIGERSVIAGTGMGARSTFVARREAGRQAPNPERRLQTWIANSERHADLDGVSVPLGSDWGGIEPGSEPNCGCTAVVE